MWAFITAVGVLIGFLTAFFPHLLTISNFNLATYLSQKTSRRSSSSMHKIDPVAESTTEPKMQEETYFNYMLAEVVTINLNPYGYHQLSLAFLAAILFPVLVATGLSTAAMVLEISSPALMVFLLIVLGWSLFAMSQFIFTASFATPTEILFRDTVFQIRSPWLAAERLEVFSASRDNAQFVSGVLSAPLRPLDVLFLGVRKGEETTRLILLPRWYAFLVGVEDLTVFRDKLNAVCRNRPRQVSEITDDTPGKTFGREKEDGDGVSGKMVRQTRDRR